MPQRLLLRRVGFFVIGLSALVIAGVFLFPQNTQHAVIHAQSTEYPGIGEVLHLHQETAQKGVLLLLSDEEGIGKELQQQAQIYAAKSYWVSLIDSRNLQRMSAEGCLSLPQQFHALVTDITARQPQLRGLKPMLLGKGIGAGFSYIALAQSPVGSYHAGLSVDFCPTLTTAMPICAERALESEEWLGQHKLLPNANLAASWYLFQTAKANCEASAVQDFIQALPTAKWNALGNDAHRLTQELDAMLNWLDPRLNSQTASSNQTGKYPLVEVIPDQAGSQDYFVLLLTGDGGWAELDKRLAEHFAQAGIATVGFDALSYFWRKRHPHEVSAAINEVLNDYLHKWSKSRVVLVGYSFGADVLPYVIEGLPAVQRGRIKHASYLGLSAYAHFEFYLTNWLSSETRKSDYPTRVALERLTQVPGSCVAGTEDSSSICSQLNSNNLAVIMLPGDHHYAGDYRRLAETLLNTWR
jgi:type IV secretory pathway VirJ component